MTNRNDAKTGNPFPMGRIAHVVQRCGLAITGALYGLFVAAHLTKANVDVFDSIGLALAMVRFGIIGFHLGSDIAPLSRKSRVGPGPKVDVIELLGAAGTFLATLATLASVYVVVFDEVLPVIWMVIVAFCWLFGVTMQIVVRLRVRMMLCGVSKRSRGSCEGAG